MIINYRKGLKAFYYEVKAYATSSIGELGKA